MRSAEPASRRTLQAMISKIKSALSQRHGNQQAALSHCVWGQNENDGRYRAREDLSTDHKKKNM